MALNRGTVESLNRPTRGRFAGRAPAIIICVALVLCIAPFASATSPRLTGVTPVGAQRGTEVELKLTGQRLEDTEEIVFYEPGIQVVKIDSTKTNAVKAQLK